MAILNMVPEFTSDETQVTPPNQVQESPVDTGQGKQTSADAQPEVKEKETPTEPPAEQKPGEIIPEDIRDTASERAIQALQEERIKLLRDIADLRGQKREIKQDQIAKVNQAIDELKDVHPDDVAVIDKVIRSKGYIRKDEAQTMWYDSVKNEELNKFLDKYPEYKPENDSNDLNWGQLQKELGFYRMPEDPHAIGHVLDRAHKAITGSRISSERSTVEQRQRQIQNAGAGSQGSAQRSSSGARVALDPEKRSMLLRGGWSEEEIQKIEQKLVDRTE